MKARRYNEAFIGEETEEYIDIGVDIHSSLRNQQTKRREGGDMQDPDKGGRDEKYKETEVNEEYEAGLDKDYEYYYPGSLAQSGARLIAPDARAREQASSGIFRQAGYFTDSHFSVFTSHNQPHREVAHVAQFPSSASSMKFEESVRQKPEFSKSKFGVFASDFSWDIPKIGIITGKNGYGKSALLDYLFGHFMAYKWQVFRFDTEFSYSIDRNVRSLGLSPLYSVGMLSNFEQHSDIEVRYINEKLRELEAGFSVVISPSKKSLLVQDHARPRHIHQLSTGQKTLLSLISWMYVLEVNVKSGKMSYIQGVAFLLDEFDVHFHPEFINGFMKFIKNYVKEIGKEFHLVSPWREIKNQDFLLS